MTMFYGDDEDNENQRFKFEMKGTNELIIIGINPSTARANPKGTTTPDTDNTINRAIGFAACNWNYDSSRIKFNGFLMLNVYAQSCSDPKELHKNRNFQLHQMNLKKINEYLQELSKKQKIYVLLAYGNTINDRNYLKCCLRDIIDILKMYNVTFFKMGKDLTSEDNPLHISRLPANTPLSDIGDDELNLILK